MITIIDENKTLNLNHMAIYLLLNTNEMKYRRKLSRIINDSEVTKGIFEYEIIERGESPYQYLPDETAFLTASCNVMIRLVNGIHRNYYYGFSKVNFADDSNTIKLGLEKFAAEACKLNIIQLEILSERNTDTSIYATKHLEQNNIVIQMFKEALECREMNAKENAEIAKTNLQKSTSSSNMKESKEIIEGVVDSEKSSKIDMEFHKDKHPDNALGVQVTITQVPTGSTYKNGTPKIGWGFSLCIEGVTVPLYLSSSIQKVLFAAILIGKTEDKPVHRKYFSKDYSNTKIIEWLKSIFLMFGINKNFEEWYDQIQRDQTKLNVEVSKLRVLIWKAVKNVNKEALYYLYPKMVSGSYSVRLENRVILDNKLTTIRTRIVSNMNGRP